MDKIKERMRKLKDDIEVAQQRETEAKNSIRETEAKQDRLGGEKTTLQSRINVVQAEVEKINDRLDESNDKLDDALARSEKSEVRRRQLVETEVDDFERSEEVESTMKTTSEMKETVGYMVAEGERRILILEKDLAKASKRYLKFAAIVEKLSGKVSEASDKIRNLEKKDRDASDREDIKEEKTKFLETKLQQSIGVAEGQERQVGKLERLKDKLDVEIEQWNEKQRKIRNEMEDVMDDIDED